MASTILSDNGVSSGSAGIKTTADSTGALALQTTTAGGAATTAVTIDTSQNVGIGVTPSAWGTAFKALQVQSTGAFIAGQSGQAQVFVGANTYYNGTNWLYTSSAAASRYYQSSGTHNFEYAASGTAGNTITWSTAMTIDSSGNLLVGTTSLNGTNGFSVAPSTFPYITLNKTASGGFDAFKFQYNSTGVGSITYTNTAVAFNTSSDYRLKENIAPLTGALTKVAALKPVTYKWKSDGSDGEGFIAHELAEVCPHAVAGEKDAVDEDGNPVYQGIDTSFLVATLTAAIQEQQALITTLTARITALEAK
jgi:hypothetical protein